VFPTSPAHAELASWSKLATGRTSKGRTPPKWLPSAYRSSPTSINAVDADVLRARVEPFGLPTQSRPQVVIPQPVLLITGADVQDDRIDASIVGWPRTSAPYVLGHVTFDGTLDDEVWSAFDKWLGAARWRNERGWRMGIDAVAVDSGGREGRTQRIYTVSRPAEPTHLCGQRRTRAAPALGRAKKVKGDMRLVNVAVDVAKTSVLDFIAREPFPRELSGGRDPAAAHFSDSLPETWFEQVTNERRRLRYRGNRPIYVFELARSGSPNEALDCCVYVYAVRFSPAVLSIHLDEREVRQPEPLDGAAPLQPRRSVAEWAALFTQV
jgi:phage terminase large subunit GpA-like protein